MLLINNASTDRTGAVAAALPDVRVIDEPRKGLVVARERGRLEARGESARVCRRRLSRAADLARADRAALRADRRLAGAVGQLPFLRLGLVGPHAAARLRLHARPRDARAREVHPSDWRGVLRRQLRRAARSALDAIGGFDTRDRVSRRGHQPRSAPCPRSATSNCATTAFSIRQRDATTRWGRAPCSDSTCATSCRNSCTTAQRIRSISTSATRSSASPSFCAIDNRKPQIRYDVRSFCLTDRSAGRQEPLRLDSHVHSTHSGRASVFPFNHFMRESYNTPDSVYQTAKRRGMDLVTITDHDQISGALALLDAASATRRNRRLRSHRRIPGRRLVRAPERARHHAGATRRDRPAASRRARADAVSASARHLHVAESRRLRHQRTA